MEEGGRWVTINGAHIFIKEGQSPMDAFIKQKGGVQMKGYPEYETSEEHRERLIKNQELQKQYEQERDEKLKEIYSSKEYDEEKALKIMTDYNNRINALKQIVVYDEKNDRYIKVNNDDIFTDKNKIYNSINQVNLTSDEENSLTNYTSQYGYGSYSNVNRYLYEGKLSSFSDKEQIEKSISNISSAMEKNKIGGNYQLYRGIEPDRINNPKIQQAITKINKAVEKGGGKNLNKYVDDLYTMVGERISNKGYMSTSKTLDPNYKNRGVTLVVNTKPTDRAIDIQNISKYGGKQDTQYAAFSKGGLQRESEVLYDKNTDLIVKDIAITNSGVFFLCDTEQKRS